ncbi:MAG: acyl-CoA thioesterase [Planctomycetaceae bacterium]|jgi:acyl-CoA thioester hydrolase|nr:acyl-CoA thioesterase [Planctomycetaceae bacterium]
MYKIYSHRVLVLSSDVDVNGHANNVCHLRWMNSAAVEHSRVNGWSPERYIELGETWFARRHTIDYLSPVLEGDELDIQTWISELKVIRSVRKYRFIRVSDGAIIAEAETLWAFVNLKTGRPTKIPNEVTDCFFATENPKNENKKISTEKI